MKMFIAQEYTSSDLSSPLVPRTAHGTKEGAEEAVSKFFYGGRVDIVKVVK